MPKPTPTEADIERAKEITDSWFVIDGKEKYISQLDVIIAQAIAEAREEGYARCKKEWDDDNYDRMIDQDLMD